MKEVKVSKEKLLAALRENRAEHIAQYDEAVANYHDKVVEEMQGRVLAVMAEQDIDKIAAMLYFDMPRPVSFEKQYDEAIAMLEWEVEPEIILDQRDFNRFVRNEWEWQNVFAASSLRYNN